MKAIRILFTACTWLFLAAAGTASAQEDYSTWAHTAKIHFNTTAAVANITLNITGFPMLVRLAPAGGKANEIIAQSLATGADVRFSDPDGTHLDFQIERWDAASGKAEFWVRIPQIDALSDKDYINIHWGKAGAAYLSDGSKVFTAFMQFAGVWHLGEGGTQARANSVGPFNHGTPVNYKGTERREGLIGMADSLDGDPYRGAYLDFGAGFADLTSSGVTFTIWAKTSAFTRFGRILDFGNGVSSDNLVFGQYELAGGIYYQAYNGGNASSGLDAPQGLAVNTWVQLGVVHNGDVAAIYRNGVMVQSGRIGIVLRNIIRTRNYLGKSNWAENSNFKGLIDEPQICMAAHSADWMRLTYESQRADVKMLTWEFPPAVRLSITSQPKAATAAEGAPVNFQVGASSSYPVSYQWYKDGVPLASAKASALSLASVTLADAGAYQCRLSDGHDSLSTVTVTLTVPEAYSTWAHSKKIFFNTTPGGADVPGDVADFPMLVRLTPDRLDFTQAGAGGKDIRFADADGAALPFQIESWAVQNGKADVWVRVPKVDGNSDKDFITLYWGKATAGPASSGPAVFSASNGFRAAYALNETSGNAMDAVSSSLNGSNDNVVRNVAGVIGAAYRFGGASSYISLPSEILMGRTAFTVGMWAREITPGTGSKMALYPTLFGSTTPGTASGDFGIVSSQGKLSTWNGLMAGNDNGSESGVLLTDGQWHHITVTYNGASVRLYESGTEIFTLPADTIPITGYAFAIGAVHLEGGTYEAGFMGDIDAVQISGTARSPDWINLAYQTQRADSKVLTFGVPAEIPPPAPTADPPGGPYEGSVLIQLSCAADNSSIFYTLDGSEPGVASGGSTHLFSARIPLAANAVIKAKAVRNGLAGATLTAAYTVRTAPSVRGDTLAPGGSINVDPTHTILYPVQETRSSVLVAMEPAWNPAPAGFDKVGPLFKVTATDVAAAFPGLQVAGDSTPGVQLYRRAGNGANLWMPPKDGTLWIPAEGAYFWGRDTLPPRIRYTGTDARGADTLRATFVMEDNVANLRCKLHIDNGTRDSLGWWSASSGEEMAFDMRVPASGYAPFELGLEATDESRASRYPPGTGRVITVARGLSPIPVPMELKPGYDWKICGMPLAPRAPLTISALSAAAGAGPLQAARWVAKPGGEGAYEFYPEGESLPPGGAFWLASGAGARILTFPASRSLASDSDGLFPIALANGWNLVTCPSLRPLAWPISRKDGDGYLRSPLKDLRGFDGSGFTRLDTLRPWEGYYVWYGGGDTVVHVGPGAARAASAAFPPPGPAPKAQASRSLMLGLKPGAGLPLEMGAADFARRGLGIEDEYLPPARNADQRSGTWITRDGAALATDYIPWDPAHAMGWTVVSRGKPAGYRMELETAALPEGFQAWAVSPARRLKYRLLPGSGIPVTGDDTLSVYAGTPEALAKVAGLILGREEGETGGFASSLRASPGGLELTLMLPQPARVDVRIWSPSGAQAGGVGDLGLGSGRHVLGWPVLGRGRGPLSQGLYLVEIRARGADRSERRVEKFGAVR
ncbi:MAG: hypothetical protein JWP91_3391 [Fibrobacteres bacterium]|nr:hypothetical protein [Fibrobacterota bacterium]